MATRGFRDEMQETFALERLEGLSGFDRIVLRGSRRLAMMGAVTLKSTSPTKKVTTVDKVVEYLRRENAVDFESGKGTAQIAKALGLGQITIQKCLPELKERGLIRSEQQGKKIRYFLSGK